jgi:hypothetical protein
MSARTKNDQGEPNNKKNNTKIVCYFVLIVIAWQSINILHTNFRTYILTLIDIDTNIYCIISFILVVCVLFYFNGFTLEGCGLV